MEDIDFLFDDSHLDKQELENIAKTAEKKPVKRDFNAVILKKFILAVIKVVSEKKPEIQLESRVKLSLGQVGLSLFGVHLFHFLQRGHVFGAFVVPKTNQFRKPESITRLVNNEGLTGL